MNFIILTQSKVTLNNGKSIRIVIAKISDGKRTDDKDLMKIIENGFLIKNDTIILDYKKSNYGMIAKVAFLTSPSNMEIIVEFIHKLKNIIIEKEITSIVKNINIKSNKNLN
jgi:hypothetical protein